MSLVVDSMAAGISPEKEHTPRENRFTLASIASRSRCTCRINSSRKVESSSAEDTVLPNLDERHPHLQPASFTCNWSSHHSSNSSSTSGNIYQLFVSSHSDAARSHAQPSPTLQRRAMNHEPSSSAQASSEHPDQDQHNAVETATSPSEMEERRKKNRDNFNKRRGELLDDLLRNLDLLVYAELSTIYYLDCSFLRFCLRAFLQLVFLTPKPFVFPEPPSSSRPYLGALGGSNLLCILLHIILRAPSAGEPTRGYLHGGLAMDFIGQKGPTSKALLLFLDLLVLVLQIVQLSVHLLRVRLRESGAAAPVSITTANGNQYGAQPVSAGQDLDDEERGVRRSAEQQQREDIEMQTLNPPDTSEQPSEEADRSSVMASAAMPSRTDAHIFDAFNSGQIVVADLDLFRTVREQFWAYQKIPRDENAVVANQQANRLMRERLARRMLRWQFSATRS